MKPQYLVIGVFERLSTFDKEMFVSIPLIFPHWSKISTPSGNKDTHGINSMRLAEVWMDEYKRLFYTHRKDLLVSA